MNAKTAKLIRKTSTPAQYKRRKRLYAKANEPTRRVIKSRMKDLL